jgi:hypothetical protein
VARMGRSSILLRCGGARISIFLKLWCSIFNLHFR